mmetsp:Transcript_8027/g.13352  ORF Transcript_8027/g.13352 Transcript_8027/m.13352 type:complete len:276 (+) Transcript_8027:133-960(+)|eukprot:CAMPEP_0174958114 /NCGR_PEP_ID=MMETSP0004_2-20121128/2447_1 /TAXON_ID=420556 /ORGANISM="Ochromonas sp., Strain CCMP1393" /LENGTH=275 /DNA_ID=CAMNT_0016206297 /DNA_START=71 /DNA_END=898 /DNA_ORIENTATION=-
MRKRDREEETTTGRSELVGNHSSQGRAPKFNRESSNGKTDIQFGSGKETNLQRIEMRLKQIQFGKNTVGYDNYLATVSREKRGCYSIHPRTPDPYKEMSKRAFDGCIKAWRRALHKWDVMEDIQERPSIPASATSEDQNQKINHATSSTGTQQQSHSTCTIIAPSGALGAPSSNRTASYNADTGTGSSQSKAVEDRQIMKKARLAEGAWAAGAGAGAGADVDAGVDAGADVDADDSYQPPSLQSFGENIDDVEYGKDIQDLTENREEEYDDEDIL